MREQPPAVERRKPAPTDADRYTDETMAASTRNKVTTALMALVIGLLALLIRGDGLFRRSMYPHFNVILDWSVLLGFIAIFVWSCLRAAKGRTFHSHLLSAVAWAVLLQPSLLFINVRLDHSEAAVVEGVVVARRNELSSGGRSGRSYKQYFDVQLADGRFVEAPASTTNWLSAEDGKSKVKLSIHPGFLHLPWIEDVQVER